MQNNANQVQDQEYETDELAPGQTLLYGQYTIERHLIDGGFGMTYLARDSLDRQVVIKECFPSTVCIRIDGEVRPRKTCYQDQYQNVIRSFLREALRLAKFEHPNIVKVHQVFQENNTAYIAMDYVDGMDLLSMLDIDPGRLTDKLIEETLRNTLQALDYVHEMGMLHRDVSPDNLLLNADNKLTLIDFGAAREDAARQTRALSTVMSVKDGYSPHEFYYTDSTQLPSSDIYSVGATFYHLITGFAPPDCQKRVAALSTDNPDPYKPLSEGRWAFKKSFLHAIDKALSISQQDRFQSASEWLHLLDNPDEAIVEIAPAASQAPVVATERELEPVAEAELEPSLAEKISSLVEDTNSKVKPTDPVKTTEAAMATSENEDDEAHPLVDIFGQPIDDVEAWLKEQDKLSKRRNAALANGAGDKANGPSDGPTGFGLSRVFSKFSKFRNRSMAMAQN